jgi:hypothetical protein
MSLLKSRPKMRRPGDVRAVWLLAGVASGAAMTLLMFWLMR